MTESEIKAYISSEVAAQLQAITSKDIASESDVPTLSDEEWDTNNSITSLPVVYNGSAWRKIGAGFLRTLRNAAAVVSTAWNALKNNGTSVSWIPTVDTSGNAGKTSPADLAAVLGGLSPLKMCKYFKIVESGDTGISVNGGNGGRAIIAIGSAHDSYGDATISSIKLLRCGYDGNYFEVTDIAESKGQDTMKLSYKKSSNNTIEVTAEYSAKYWVRVLLISNKPF